MKGNKGDKIHRIIANVSQTFIAHETIGVIPDPIEDEALQDEHDNLEVVLSVIGEVNNSEDSEEPESTTPLRTLSGRNIRASRSNDFIFW